MKISIDGKWHTIPNRICTEKNLRPAIEKKDPSGHLKQIEPIRYSIKKETEKAILIDSPKKEAWLPKSMVKPYDGSDALEMTLAAINEKLGALPQTSLSAQTTAQLIEEFTSTHNFESE